MTIAELIAVLQTLPPDARTANFSWDDNKGTRPIEIYYGTVDGVPTLWTEYDCEVGVSWDGDTKRAVSDLWKDMQGGTNIRK